MKKRLAGFLLAAALAGCGPKHASFVKVDDVALGRVVVYRNGVAFYERRATVTGGTLTVTSPDDKPKNPNAPKKPEIPEEQMAAQVAMMKPMVAGMRMTVELNAANGIASSDATHVNGDTITFMDVEFDKLLEKPEVFGEIMEAGDNLTQAEAAEKFKNVPGIKMEGKKTFKVVLK